MTHAPRHCLGQSVGVAAYNSVFIGFPDDTFPANADETADSPEETEHLPALTFSSSPSPVPQDHPHSRLGTMLEAGDVSNAITSPILGSAELRTAVAAAQARAAADLNAVTFLEQHADGGNELSWSPDTPAEPAEVAPADRQSKTEQEGGSALGVELSHSDSHTLVQVCEDSSGGSLEGGEQPCVSQAPAVEACPSVAEEAGDTAQGQDAGPEEAESADNHSAALRERPSALCIEVEGSSDPAWLKPASTGHAGTAASPFHSLASPNRFLEGSQSPELQASMSPGTPAEVTLQPANGPSTAVAVDSPSMQEALDSCLSPATTEPDEASMPASYQTEAAARRGTPAGTLAHTGEPRVSADCLQGN